MKANRRTFVVTLAFVGALLLLWTIRYLDSTGSIEILAAEYGVPGRTCSAGPAIMQHASAACGGFRPRCLISASAGWCGDPAPGLVKTLTVDYTCGGTKKRASGTDGAGVVLSCP